MVAASLTSRPARAAPAISATADEHYERGRSEREAKRFAAAAAEFAIAYKEIPPTQSQRATVLFELVDAHRSAFAAGGRVRGREHPAKHLCDAEASLTEFIDLAEKKRAPKAKRSPDARMAGELRTDVRAELDEARKTAADLDCATVELPRDDVPEPAAAPGDDAGPRRPRRAIHKPFVIAGAVTTGVGMIFVGLMANGLVRGKRAERDGDALVATSPTLPEQDPLLQAIDDRGRGANHLAIAGGVIGTAALGAGIALLVIGLRGGPGSRVALSPTFSRRELGLLVRWQF